MIGVCIAWTLMAWQGAPVPTGVQPGDRVTVHFLATLKDGRERADTERRALPFTFVVGGTPTVRVLDALVRGMAAGAIKTVEVSEADAFGAEGVPPIIPPHAAMTVRVRLLKVVKAPPPPAGRLPGC